MLTYLKWTFWISFWTLIAAFFHYTLPGYDTVRVTDTYERRIDAGANSMFWSNANTGNATGVVGRDVFFIETFGPNGRPRVYRNEDTGWGWPPYFKFDTTNLQAEASNFTSTADEPRWVAIRHYGWRNEFFSIFPNALAVVPVDGPDAGKFSYTRLGILAGFGLFAWFVWGRIRAWRRRQIDPWLDDSEEGWALAEQKMKPWWRRG